ncbi:MAG: 23S rRNA (pseudouridine(1915)-N(3))-methyltransferase RlmH [Candidatus Cloacimonetes bacterium]|nr:23S rRNA (pseudouridine(1915)-N(3))-methyltransferase RlmH [Candidatus Cloacimonadota bacterium]
MKIRVLCPGKTRQDFLAAGMEEYLKRIRKYTPIQVEIIPDASRSQSADIMQVKAKEAVIINSRLNEGDYLICLDEQGKQFSSPEFAGLLKNISSEKNITFIIGGVYGLAEEIRDKCNLVLSFSKFTFTHQMIRLLLLEQIYRGFTIIEGKKYHY